MARLPRQQPSLGHIRGYGHGHGSSYGYISRGYRPMRSRRKTPTFLVILLVLLGIAALLALLVGGSAWWDYSKFLKATKARNSQNVALAVKKGTRAPVPGASQLFWMFAARHASAQLGKAANEDSGGELVAQYIETYKDTPDIINRLIIPKATSATEQYKDMLLDEQVAKAYLDIGLQLRPSNPDLLAGKELFDILVASRAAFAAAQKAAEQPFGSEEAADLYEQVAEVDADNYEIAQAAIPDLRLKASEELDTWALPVKHFTLNPLLAFPYMTPLDYANDYITVPEFKAVLEQLNKNDYILVGLNTLFDVDGQTGKVTPRTLRVPRGKKPFVLSIENLNYSTRLARQGMVDKLIVKDGKIATWTLAYNADDQKDVVSFDNDVIPVLDTFIEEHPLFSWKGARATISLTGYRGIFGYQTAPGAKNQEKEIAKAKEIATILKQNGYTFASLGCDYVEMSTLDEKKIRKDLQKWNDQVASIVGTTTLFFWPFGDTIEQNDKRTEEIRQFGYHSFSQIGPNGYDSFTSKARIDERGFINGNGFFNYPDNYDGYFDPKKVIDQEGRDRMTYWLTW